MEGKGALVKIEKRARQLEGDHPDSDLGPTEKDIDDLKAKYKLQHRKHAIHKVDDNGRIVLEEVKINDFAVKLTISDSKPALDTFRGETDRFLKQLQGMRVHDIEPSQLININRVTFVSAIAGSGKSVLVKQLTYLWATGELFQEFPVCITFECGELNYFIQNEGKKFEKREQFVEFIKGKFGFNVKESTNVLFIVDAIDELVDVNSRGCIIAQLIDLKKSKYPKSKVIITGRPHIEHMLSRHGGRNMGGLRKVEIVGLSDEQIDEYICKLASSNEEKVAKMIKARNSHRNLKILHIPQMLNSFYCVSLLQEEAENKNAAELYCWLLYLLLKEHAEKDGSNDKLIPDIFNEYSKELLELSKICHELLNKNTIIFEGNIECGDNEKGKEFLKGLFIDASKDFTRRKKFKHLTLMEFFSAVYVCATENRTEIIKDILEKRLYQVLLFNCQLISGLMYDGIIKEMFKNAAKLKEINCYDFFCKVLELVRECGKDDVGESFELSVDVIMCLINNDAIDKQFMLSIVNQLSFKNVGKYSISRSLIGMMKPLQDTFEFSDLIMKSAFKNVHFGKFYVIELNEFKYAKFLASVDWITLNGSRMAKVRDIVKEIDELNEWEECKRVEILTCELQDEEFDDKLTDSSKLERLYIEDCILNRNSFFNLSKWMITSSVEEFKLRSIKGMKVEWWKMTVDAIENAKEKNGGDFALRELEIFRCPLMNNEMKKKLIECGIALTIYGKEWHPSLPVEGFPDDLNSDDENESQDDVKDVERAQDDTIKFDLPTDESNFVKIKKILLNVVPKHLRKLFIEQWNRKYRDQEWESNHVSGNFLCKEISDKMSSTTNLKKDLKKLSTGNEQEWNAAILIFIMLDSGLQLCSDHSMSEDMKTLKDIESSFFADKSKTLCSSADFMDKMEKIKRVAKNIFDEDANVEINDIENSPEERKMKIKMRQLLAKEKSRTEGISKSDKALEKGYRAPMEFRPEEANFTTIDNLLLSIIPWHLRSYFKTKWNQKYNPEWESSPASGEILVSKISNSSKTTMDKEEIKKLKEGNEQTWSIAALANVLLDSGLKLVTKDCKQKEGIENLMEIEKSFYEDNLKMECSFDDFYYVTRNIMSASKRIFSESANDEINGVVKSHEENLKAVQLAKEIKDPEQYFTLIVEEVCFAKITKIVFNILTKYLRKCFIEHWNKKYSANQWNSDEASGQVLINKIPARAKTPTYKVVSEKLLAGNENKWDTTTLVYVMLFSDLKLIPKCRAKDNRVRPLLISEEIDIIRDKRNTAFAHAGTMSCSSDEFRKIIAELKSVANNIFGRDAEYEIDRIAKSQRRMQMSEENKRQMDEEISIHKKFERALKEQDNVLESKAQAIKEEKSEVKDRKIILENKALVMEEQELKAIGQVPIEVKSGGALIVGNNAHIHFSGNNSKPERSIDDVSDHLKTTYKKIYQKHQIHAVDERNKIVLKEVDIADFAVTLKICHTSPPACTYKDETRKHLENLIGTTSNDIDKSKLLHESYRVTFVRGIAGVGKSVLAKQLACHWANNDMYTDFKLLIMFECRNINQFKANKGSDLKEHELIDEFLKMNLNCTYGYGENIMFVIDGLDELDDIHTDDSIIFGLLDYSNAKYSNSKFIITGRPRVECNLRRYDKPVGGMQQVEIQGLSDKQIKEYVKTFARTEKDCSSICQAIDSSERLLPILHVPQFLNTYCCVVLTLAKGEKVSCKAELYTWTILLLLQQHADRQGQSNTQADYTFQKYSKELMALAKVCYNLLITNKIIFEEDIESLLSSSEIGQDFFKSLFVDLSDKETKTYQFKHLSLVEFLAAFHVCCTDKRIECIKDILEKDYIETVVHACELIANSACSGMIQKMLFNAASVKDINVSEIMRNILKIVCESKLDHGTKFERSLELLTCFLVKGATEKESILSSLQELRCGPLFKSVASDSYKLHAISEHLKTVHNCKEEELKTAFKNIQIGEFIVNEVETVGCVKYLGTVDLIDFNGMGIGVNTARRKVEMIDGGNCSIVWIEDCEFNENEDDIDHLSTSNLDELVIWNSKLNGNSFMKSIDWGASSGKLILDQLKVESAWWHKMVETIEEKNAMVETIEEKNASIDFNLRELIITRCKPKISEELVERVQRCEVQLIIDGIIFPSLSKKSARASTSRSSSSAAEPDTCAQSTSSAGRKRTSVSTEAAVEKSYPSEKIQLSTSTLSSIERYTPEELDDPVNPESFPNLEQLSPSSSLESIAYQQDADISGKNAKKVQVTIGCNGKIIDCKSMKLSLTIPPNAVERKVKLNISAISKRNAPPIPCHLGELALNDIVQIEPLGMRFREPAILSIYHGITDLPELSSIVMKWYDYNKAEWLKFDLPTGEATQRLGVTTAAISTTSCFVLCKSLDTDVYTVPNSPSSYFPFGPKYGVKLMFEGNTFGDDVDAVLEFKMNIFPKEAVDELYQLGIQPFPVLHIKERLMRQPAKPVTAIFPMSQPLQSNEKVLVFKGKNDETIDITEVTKFVVGDDAISVQLSHFCWINLVRLVIDRFPIREDFANILSTLREYFTHRFNVHFRLCGRQGSRGNWIYRILCYRDDQNEDFQRLKREYVSSYHLCEVKLYDTANVTGALDGSYEINNRDGNVTLRFDHSAGANCTQEFIVKEVSDDEYCALILSKADGRFILKEALFDPF